MTVDACCQKRSKLWIHTAQVSVVFFKSVPREGEGWEQWFRLVYDLRRVLGREGVDDVHLSGGHTWAQHGSQGHTSSNLVSRGLAGSTEKQWDANRTMGPIPRSLLPVPPSGNVCSLDIKCIPHTLFKGPVRNTLLAFNSSGGCLKKNKTILLGSGKILKVAAISTVCAS